MVMSMPCEECDELLARYRDATQRFAQLTRRLADAVEGSERDLTAAVWNSSREVHAECDAIRKLILAHLQIHKPVGL